MSGWTTHEGLAVVLDRESIDTDQIIPARFMSTPRSEGYGQFLFRDLARDAEGRTLPDFPLNAHASASILITRRNFGSGSSREAAVYALVDAGIRAVLAPSFGDIFASNAVNNGLLPARLEEEAIDTLVAALGQGAAPARIDLERSTAMIGETAVSFDLDPVWRAKLINGWDDIDLTFEHQAAIAAYRERLVTHDPWRFPADAG